MAGPGASPTLLGDHPQIEAAAVVSVSDGRMGEVGQAFVILRPGQVATPEAIGALARTHMANYKVSRSLSIVETFPRNASGKVLRTDLKQLSEASS